MRKMLLRFGVAIALLAAVLEVKSARAQETPTDKIYKCMDAAGDRFVECVEMNAWYWTWPCTWRFEADIILCLPKAVTGVGGVT